MVSFEIFVKAMPPSLSELKVTPSFCFAFKIPDDRAVTTIYHKTVNYTRNSNKVELHIELNSIAHSGTALKPNKTENVSPAFIKFCLPFGKVHCS